MDTLSEKTKMDAIYLTGAGMQSTTEGLGQMEFGQIDIPIPRNGQVLVKVESIPINPSDIYLMEGKYTETLDLIYPFVPGWEGSGTVVASGGGIMGWYLKGKRVSFSKAEEHHPGTKIKFNLGGTMAQYWVTNAYQCIPLDNDVSFNQGAAFFTNPLTALAFEEIAVNGQVKTIAMTAAASQLGRMIIRLLKPHNINIIAIVRKEDQANLLKEDYKLKYVLNSSDEDFFDQFSKLVSELSPSYMFEAIPKLRAVNNKLK